MVPAQAGSDLALSECWKFGTPEIAQLGSELTLSASGLIVSCA